MKASESSFFLRPFTACASGFLLLFAGFTHGGSQPQILTSNGASSGFELYDSTSLAGPTILTWDSPGVCGGEFPRVASVRNIGGGLGSGQTPAPLKVISNACNILDVRGGTAVRDATYVYYFAERILRKKPLGAKASDPHTTVSLPITTPILPSDQGSSALEISGGQIYWGHYTSSNGNLSIRKANPITGTSSSVKTIFGANAPIAKIQKFSFGNIIGSSGGIAVLLSNGRLYRINLDSNNVALVATSVTDFVIHAVSTLSPFFTTYIYASKGSLSANPSPNAPAGSVVRIVGTTGAATTIYTASGNSQIQSIAADPGTSHSTSGHNLYISQAPVDCFGLLCVLGNHIIRRSTTGNLSSSSVSFTTIINSSAGIQLASDGDFLYYSVNGNGTNFRQERVPPILAFLCIFDGVDRETETVSAASF